MTEIIFSRNLLYKKLLKLNVNLESPIELRIGIKNAITTCNVIVAILERNSRLFKRNCSERDHNNYPQISVPLENKNILYLRTSL